MCLIIACPPGKRPSVEPVHRSCQKNDDGSGVSWVQGGHVHWAKGLSEEKLLAILSVIPKELPLVIHNRLATVGGECAALSHPFLLSFGQTPNEGSTKQSMLFHNGHWNDWKDMLLSTLAARKMRLPNGPWSDSRALALLTHVYGEEFLNFVSEQRVCIVSPSGFITYGSGWSSHEECLVSNSYSFSAPTTIEVGYGKGWSRDTWWESNRAPKGGDSKRYEAYWKERESTWSEREAIERQASIDARKEKREEAEALFLSQDELEAKVEKAQDDLAREIAEVEEAQEALSQDALEEYAAEEGRLGFNLHSI
jgi:hypothetical protein